MLVVFLVILFSDLTFVDLSIQSLIEWYDYHPFIAILTIQDIIFGSLILFRLFNICTDFEEKHSEECEYIKRFFKDSGVWTVYTNESKK